MTLCVWLLVANAVAADRYVVASTLNLRKTPSADAAVVMSLPINTCVTPSRTQGDFTEVRTPKGRTGWVATRCLVDAALTADEASGKAASATSAKERLTWAQRAAAVLPRPSTLEALEAAYRGVGDAAAAERVAAERRWSGNVQLVLDTKETLGKVRVSLPAPAGAAAEGPWWVLPARGPAVAATIESTSTRDGYDCDMRRQGTELVLNADLQEGVRPVAAAWGPQPTGWDTDRKWTVPLTQEDAESAARAEADSEGLGPRDLVAVGLPDGWFVRMRHVTRERNGFFDAVPANVLDVHVGTAGVRVLRSWSQEEGLNRWVPMQPSAVRDLTGDGVPEVVWSREISDANGTTLATWHHVGECDI